jgi:hypothetical protein
MQREENEPVGLEGNNPSPDKFSQEHRGLFCVFVEEGSS